MARQFGVITRAQALENDLTRRQIDRLIGSGEWIVVLPGVYRMSVVLPSFRQRAIAAALWAGEGSLVSHNAAAALWRLDGVGRPERIDVTMTTAGSRRSDIVKVRWSTDLVPADRSAVDGIAVTSPLRTVLDVAADIEPKLLERAVEDALRRGLVSEPRLRWRLGSRTGRGFPGSGNLRSLMEQSQLGATDSSWELRAARVLTDAGLPEPIRQFPVQTAIGLLHVDLAYAGPAVVVLEYDSDEFHSARRRRHRDVERRNALRAAGCLVIELTSSIVRQPDRLVALTLAALERAS